MSRHEPKGGNEGGKPLIPSMWCLFKTIERFGETTDKVCPRGINKVKRLLTIYSLRKIAVQKGIFNIELMNMPISSNIKSKNNSDGCLKSILGCCVKP